MRADLVVEQGLGPRRPRCSGGRNEEVTVRHHHAGASLAQLDVGLDVGGERPVPVELVLGEPYEGVGIEPRTRVGPDGATLRRMSSASWSRAGATAPNARC